MLALSAVVAGAQQTILLDRLQRDDDCNAKRKQFWADGNSKWGAMFAWQMPLMFLSYAFVLFLAGLTTWVVSPVVGKGRWDGDAKVSLLLLEVGYWVFGLVDDVGVADHGVLLVDYVGGFFGVCDCFADCAPNGCDYYMKA